MLIGDPYKLAFLIERVPEWEGTYINGLMFLFINGNIYPEQTKTTTLNCELPVLLDENESPFMNPVKNKELYKMNSHELFNYISKLVYPDDINTDNDYRYLIDFHEINDAGYSIFIISDDCNIKLLVGKWTEQDLLFIDEIEISMQEYETIKRNLVTFYNDGKL